MTDYYCSVCWKNEPLTMVNGTVICQSCLQKVAEQNKKKDNSLKEELKNAIVEHSMGDIYD